jgi:hypothetical protein
MEHSDAVLDIIRESGMSLYSLHAFPVGSDTPALASSLIAFIAYSFKIPSLRFFSVYYRFSRLFIASSFPHLKVDTARKGVIEALYNVFFLMHNQQLVSKNCSYEPCLPHVLLFSLSQTPNVFLSSLPDSFKNRLLRSNKDECENLNRS